MSGARDQKKKETRQAIMEAAIRLFGEQGYEGTSIEDLASAANIGKGTIYGYFATKQEIFQAFCDEEIEASFKAVRESVDPEAPLLQQLVALFMFQFQFVTENREFGRHLLREVAFPKETSEKSLEHVQQYIDALEGLLERAKEKGQIRRDIDLNTATGSFYMLYLGCLSAWYIGHIPDIQSAEESMTRLFQQTLEGIGL